MADTRPSIEKLLPQSVDAEASVLGSIIYDPDAMARMAGYLEASDFYREAHRTIYQAALSLFSAQEPIDLITLRDELERRGALEDVGGISYVSSLTNDVPTSAHVDSYARIVRRCARNRALIHAAGQIAAVAYNQPDDDAAVDVALDLVLKVASRGSTSGQTITRSLAQVLNDLATDVMARMDADTPPGIPTGFVALDQAIVGIEAPDLIYLAGRPGSGKSALGLKIALQAALHLHARALPGSVDVVTLEMSARQQARRLVADRSEQNTRYIRSGFREHGTLGDPDLDAWARFDEQRLWLQERAGDRLFFTDGVVSMASLRALVQRAVAERGCRLVVIDQLDLFSDDGDEYERVTKMSRQLKRIAKACGVAILCMVQLSRKVEERRNKRPLLSDLRQSGQLEQDADAVWGIYRAAYYDAKNDDPYFKQHTELLLLKGRDTGAGATIHLRFEEEYTRFRDWPADWQIPPDEETSSSTADGARKERDA